MKRHYLRLLLLAGVVTGLIIGRAATLVADDQWCQWDPLTCIDVGGCYFSGGEPGQFGCQEVAPGNCRCVRLY